MRDWEAPGYLFILIPIWLWTAYSYWKGEPSLSFRIRFPGAKPESKDRIFEFFQYAVPLLRPIALSLIVVSLSGPGKTYRFLPRETEGVDIMIALDVSGSMSRSRDFLPETRLGVSKKLLREFIRKRERDRIGLVVFAGGAYLQSPLTSDRSTLEEILAVVEEETVPEQGTAIGDAVILSSYRLRRSPARSRVIVLITDGVSNTGRIDPVTATEIADGIGIKIYCIGIGKEDQSYEINFDILAQLSEKTGGVFYRAEDTGQLREVLASIDSLERDPLSLPPEEIRETDALIYLILGLLLISLDLIFRVFLTRYYV
ncbi:aerotolerance regulator BatA [Leptospira perolatii]|uniref:Aerotolerance regulator BatA n=1 Tax=Leptospira perolatii TaxID=2023191 RepID=A0A2M9ZPQ8_9LEPT|nr:VWA domain-containing protein [Leptospira perolatii]PJZ70937.1 aerotolerance regulator BatA [Leptospira perolatii]PJZ74062.1 aerotolerance regulator BatA [Leptospira perolatii]